MDKSIFDKKFTEISTYLNITGITKLTMDLYFDQLETIPNELFLKTVEQLIKTWKYKHFPLVADFIEAYKAIKPTESTYRPVPRDDKAFNPMVGVPAILEGLRCQDKIKEQLLKPIYGNDWNNGFDYKDKRDRLKTFLSEKVKKLECWSRQTEQWIKRADAVVAGNYYFNPERFGW